MSKKCDLCRPIRRGFKVQDKITGVIYNSVGEASRQTGIGVKTLRNWLNNTHPNKSNLVYYNERDKEL